MTAECTPRTVCEESISCQGGMGGNFLTDFTGLCYYRRAFKQAPLKITRERRETALDS
jgi:hypothetical protein